MLRTLISCSCTDVVEYSYLNRELCICPHYLTLVCSGHSSDLSRFFLILNPFSSLPAAHPSLQTKQETSVPPPWLLKKYDTNPTQNPKNPTQNPLSVSWLIIGNHCSLTTACRPVLHCSKMTDSSCRSLQVAYDNVS